MKNKNNLLKMKKVKLRCPVCNKYYFTSLNSYEICPICNWENDLLQNNNPDLSEGANKLNLKQAIEKYRNEK